LIEVSDFCAPGFSVEIS